MKTKLTHIALFLLTFAFAGRVQASEYALKFDGTNYVNFNQPNLNLSNELSVLAWVKWDTATASAANWANIISVNSSSRSDFGQFWIQHNQDNSKFEFALSTQNSDGSQARSHIRSVTQPQKDVWYHIAAVYNGNQMLLYINGILEASLNKSGSIFTSQSNFFLTMGAWAYGTGNAKRPFIGSLNEVSIWNKTLDNARINQIKENNISNVSESGLIAYWNFNNSATTVTDANQVVNGNAFTLNNVLVNPTYVLIPNPNVVYGQGTIANPYIIANLNHLKWIADNPNTWNAHFIQIADIDASETQSWNNGQGWSPIGNNSVKFSGTYNAQGHLISNLFINRPNLTHVGLFGYINNGAKISKLGMVNVNFTGNQNVGGIAGSSRGVWNAETVIELSFVTGVLNGFDAIGGIVGRNEYASTIQNSYSQCTATCAIWKRAGGVVGQLDAGTITNVYSSSIINVASTNQAGGISGNGWANTTNTFFNRDLRATSSVGTGKTTQELKSIPTYTNWNIVSVDSTQTNTNFIWNIIDGSSFPFLSWEAPRKIIIEEDTIVEPEPEEEPIVVIDDSGTVLNPNNHCDNALKFDGTNYVDFGNVDYNFGNQMTFTAWVRWDVDSTQSPSWSNIASVNSKNSTNYGQFWLQHNQQNSKFEFALSTDRNNTHSRTFLYSTTSPTEGEWYHIAAVYNGQRMLFYINGVLEASKTHTGNVYPSQEEFAMNFGAWAFKNSRRQFNGAINHVSLWNVALDSNSIAGIINDNVNIQDNGLLGYWDFNDNAQKITDSKGQNHGRSFKLTGDWVEPTYVDGDSRYCGGFNIYTGGIGNGNNVDYFVVVNEPDSIEEPEIPSDINIYAGGTGNGNSVDYLVVVNNNDTIDNPIENQDLNIYAGGAGNGNSVDYIAVVNDTPSSEDSTSIAIVENIFTGGTGDGNNVDYFVMNVVENQMFVDVDAPSSNDEKIVNTSIVENTEMIEIAIYPNPSNGYFNVRGFSYDEASIVVLNSIGQIVYAERIQNQSDVRIDISSQPKGIYHVLVEQNNLRITKSVVKNQ